MELSYFTSYFLPSAWSIFNGSKTINLEGAPTDNEIISSIASVIEKFVTSVSSNMLENNIGLTTNSFKWAITESNKLAIREYLRSKGIIASEALDDIITKFKEYFTGYRTKLENDIQTSIYSTDSSSKNVSIQINKATYKEILELYRLQLEGSLTNVTTIGNGETITINKSESIFSNLDDYLVNDGYIAEGCSFAPEATASYDYNSLTVAFIHNKVNDRYLPCFVFYSSENNDFDFTNIRLNTEIGASSNTFNIYATNQSKTEIKGIDEFYGQYLSGFERPYSDTLNPLIGTVSSIMKTKHIPTSGLILTIEPLYTAAFYSGMTTSEKSVSSNYELIPYIVNNHYGETAIVHELTVADNVKQSIIADTFDIITLGNSDLISDRVDQGRLINVGYDTIGTIAVTPATDIVDALSGALVYPADTVTDKTLSISNTMTIASAVAAVDTAAATSGISTGIPYVPLVSQSGTYGLITLYKVTSANLKALSSILWSQDFLDNFHPFANNPQDALISLMAYPINISAGASEVITCGNYECTGAYGSVVTNLFQEHNLGSVTVPKYFNNYMDYAPYTSIDLYLPFVGRVQLDPNEVMGSILTLSYRVELLTGTCAVSVNVKKDKLNGKLYQYTGNMAISLPITSNNFGQIYTNLVSSAMSVGVGIASGTGLGAAAAGANILNTMFSTPSISRGGGMSGNSGMCGSMAPYLIITRAIPDIPNGYKSLHGIECNDYVTIGSLSGYVELDSFELVCESITIDEQTELVSLLHSGIII